MKTPKIVTEYLNFDCKRDGISSAYITAPLDEGYSILKLAKYRLINLEEEVTLMLERGLSSEFSREGELINGVVLHLPNGKNYLVKRFPSEDYIMKLAESHKDGKRCFLNNKEIPLFLSNSVLLPDNPRIETKSFGNNKFVQQMFGPIAAEYGRNLIKKGLEEIFILGEKSKKIPFISPIWFGGHEENFIIYSGSQLDVSYPLKIRGIFQRQKPSCKKENINK